MIMQNTKSKNGGCMKIRRVVTGHNPSGKAVFTSDSLVDATTAELMPGMEIHNLWGGDRTPSFPDDGKMPPHVTYFPPVGGFRFGMFTVPPQSHVGPAIENPERAAAELEAKLPGLASYMEPDAPGMHTTDTLDFEVVLEGEVWLELDDGAEVHLRAGDTVVQNGTRHAWRNKGTVPARLAIFIVGARHAKVSPR
jgi:mannose-6-phosphate isomerase-like protein (cupin superfamily)